MSKFFISVGFAIMLMFTIGLISASNDVSLKCPEELNYEKIENKPFLSQYGASTIILDDYNSKIPCRIVDDAGQEFKNFVNNTDVQRVVIDTMYLQSNAYLVVQADNYNPIISALATPVVTSRYGNYDNSPIIECEPVYGDNYYEDFDFALITNDKFKSYLMNLSYFQVRIRPTDNIYVQDLYISGKDDFGIVHFFKTQLAE